jgi:Fe2+ transport system protein FeoA
LADIQPGHEATVLQFDERISTRQMENLQAYGLVPGRRVRVLQHLPETIIQVEHTELALEKSLADKVIVDHIS